jgi:integrase
VPDEHVNPILPHLSAQVRAMVELQRVTGMRPAEVCAMRSVDIDRTVSVWVYRPPHHKTMHRGHTREVFIGPKGQILLAPWLREDSPESHLFSPAAAEDARHAARLAGRKTPKWPSHMRRNATKRKADPKRAKREHYDPDTYRRAIEYACKKAGVPVWAPNRLRHSAATEIRKAFGIETARILLGHKTAFTTEIYAEADREAAAEAVKKAG